MIDQLAFDLLPGFSGGWVTYDPVPVVLFEGGTLCDCSDENRATLDLDELDFDDGNLEQISALTSDDARDAARRLPGSAYTRP